jgi:hypothetical protein
MHINILPQLKLAGASPEEGERTCNEHKTFKRGEMKRLLFHGKMILAHFSGFKIFWSVSHLGLRSGLFFGSLPFLRIHRGIRLR